MYSYSRLNPVDIPFHNKLQDIWIGEPSTWTKYREVTGFSQRILKTLTSPSGGDHRLCNFLTSSAEFGKRDTWFFWQFLIRNFEGAITCFQKRLFSALLLHLQLSWSTKVHFTCKNCDETEKLFGWGMYDRNFSKNVLSTNISYTPCIPVVLMWFL